MADICLLYVSEDLPVVSRLVALLREHWDVWWAPDLIHGDWETQVRAAITDSKVVVPVLSSHATRERVRILGDEMRLAQRTGKTIIPFALDRTDPPFGFGTLVRVTADGWGGDPTDPGYSELVEKLTAAITGRSLIRRELTRTTQLQIRQKQLLLPHFVFSLSSYETQVTPKDGATLLGQLDPGAVLVSAFDLLRAPQVRSRELRGAMQALYDSSTVVVLDSGNYEAFRKRDHYSPKSNPLGWQRKLFRQVAASVPSDLVFSFDHPIPTGSPDKVAARVIAGFEADVKSLSGGESVLCPIIHIPHRFEGTLSACAARIATIVASTLDPVMLAIPERELGDGLIQRASTVRHIRTALNSLGKYYPLHLLGTGNPLTMAALAVAGADSFDGLEWCRTIADYNTGALYHFQQFECFKQACLPRVQAPTVRNLIENPAASYHLQALSYNIDFYLDWTRTMRSLIHAGQSETLLRMVPSIGPTLHRQLTT